MFLYIDRDFICWKGKENKGKNKKQEGAKKKRERKRMTILFLMKKKGKWVAKGPTHKRTWQTKNFFLYWLFPFKGRG